MTSAVGVTLFAAAAVLYAAASVAFYWAVTRSISVRATRAGRLAPWLLGMAAAAHAGYVVIASFVAHSCPVRSIHFGLSLASLSATVVYLGARRRFRIGALGLVLGPVGLLLAISTFFLGRTTPAGALSPSFIALHVFANLLGSALFMLAAGSAGLYLVQERRLKRKTARATQGMPALDSLDKALHRFLLAAFPLLTLGIVTGTVETSRLAHAVTTEAALRNVLGFGAWLMLGGVLLLRFVAGWRGRRAAWGAVVGFACAVLVLLLYVLRPVPLPGLGLGG
jgi:ABC-type uncharacterized transport system permease subunit